MYIKKSPESPINSLKRLRCLPPLQECLDVILKQIVKPAGLYQANN